METETRGNIPPKIVIKHTKWHCGST